MKISPAQIPFVVAGVAGLLVLLASMAEKNRDWTTVGDCRGFGYIYYSADDTPETRYQVEVHNRHVENTCGGRSVVARPHQIMDDIAD